MVVNSKTVKLNNLNNSQKVNYIKNLLFSNEINKAIDEILLQEKKDLALISIIIDCLNDESICNKIKQDSGLKDDKTTKLFVYSKIISILSFYNKSVILNALFKSFDSDTLKSIAIYEYNNKTEVSLSSKIFEKYCLKYKEDAKKRLEESATEILYLTEESNTNKSKKKSRKTRLFILISLFVLIIIFIGYEVYKYSNIIKEYDGKIMNGIYLNDMNLSKVNIEDIDSYITEEQEKIESGSLIVTNLNDDYKFTYEEVGIKVNIDGVTESIKAYNENLNFFDKVLMLNSKKKNKTFYIEGYFDEESINSFMNLLEKRINTRPTDDGIVEKENHEIIYSEGSKGFTLDVSKTKAILEAELKTLKEETIITAEGDIEDNTITKENLSVINKKIATYTTYFANSGNRGHNIVLAASKLNGTILNSGDTFSYLKVVGPYGASNGYLPAPIYFKGQSAIANGGGVCQLASTLYMAQLYAGLQTVYRTNHSFAPTYVPQGLDATVYSTTTDYKFKNQYDYPIYIQAYAEGDNLTVSLWSSDKTMGNKSYEPYSYKKNSGWVAYLKEYENGTFIKETYLGISYYKSH